MMPFTGPNLMPYGLPDVQEAYRALLEAGGEALKWGAVSQGFDKEMAESGFPNLFGGFCMAPFDAIGDCLRGTKGIMMDMYRQPDKLIEALEAITPLLVKMGVAYTEMSGNPIVLIPIHKGADGFLSDEQFRTFYWPTFRKVLTGLIDEGRVPCTFAEGGYNSRLEIIRDLPKGKALWMFDLTDMARAKQVLGDVCCIGGNIPITMLKLGTPGEVTDYARKLIDTAGRNGGYIMFAGAVIDEARSENIRAMIGAAKEYGVYR
jgi:uroporphyrinogen-III decarboxylase